MEKAEAGGIGGLGGKKKFKILQLYEMRYDASRWRRWKGHAITNGDVSFCCRPSVWSVPDNNPCSFGSYQTFGFEAGEKGAVAEGKVDDGGDLPQDFVPD